MAVYVVPPVTSELGLIENCPVCAEERSSLFTLTAVVADVISLIKENLASGGATKSGTNLAGGLNVGVDTRKGRNVLAREASGWDRVEQGVVHSRDSRDFT